MVSRAPTHPRHPVPLLVGVRSRRSSWRSVEVFGRISAARRHVADRWWSRCFASSALDGEPRVVAVTDRSALHGQAFGPSPTPSTTAVAKRSKLVKPDDGVTATYYIVPHLTHRVHIYEFPNPFIVTNWGVNGEDPPDPKTSDVLVLDTALNGDDAGALRSRWWAPAGRFGSSSNATASSSPAGRRAALGLEQAARQDVDAVQHAAAAIVAERAPVRSECWRASTSMTRPGSTGCGSVLRPPVA